MLLETPRETEVREVIREGWGWYLALGIALASVRVLAIAASAAAAFVSILTFSGGR